MDAKITFFTANKMPGAGKTLAVFMGFYLIYTSRVV